MLYNADQPIVIVGGSLCGLTLALACANKGIQTKVLERSADLQRSGASLGIDRDLLMRTVGANLHTLDQDTDFPVLTKHRNAVSWDAIYGWLRNQVSSRSNITLVNGCNVLKVSQARAAAHVITADGICITASVVVGADGYRSVVRAAINPAIPHANYAGYVLWRGLIDEREMPMHTSWPCDDNGTALVHTDGYRLVAYPVAGMDGSLEPGRRRIGFAWYDPTRDALLRDQRCISHMGQVLGSLPPRGVPDQVRAELRELAQRIWPGPWSDFIVHALDQRKVFATPVAEFFPERLYRGRLVIVGDAAHVVSPLTGRGFVTSTMDADTLASCLVQARDRSFGSVSLALSEYQTARLEESQELVRTSSGWSRAYLRDVGFRRSGQSWPTRSF